jgi:hypothetical protein
MVEIYFSLCHAAAYFDHGLEKVCLRDNENIYFGGGGGHPDKVKVNSRK